jgi:hypothetical protein
MDDMATYEAFARYASAQAAFGLYLLRTHRRDASGSCRECAHRHPCAQRRHGAELIIHFGQWNSRQLHSETVASTPVTSQRVHMSVTSAAA